MRMNPPPKDWWKPVVRYGAVIVAAFTAAQAAGWLTIWKPTNALAALEQERQSRQQAMDVEIASRIASDSLLSARITQIEERIHADLAGLIRLECIKAERNLTRAAGLDCH
jgi:hypothetical protein